VRLPRRLHRDRKAGGSAVATPLSQEIQKALEILKAYGAKRVVLFGSAARRQTTEADPIRDLDLACEGLPPDCFFEAWGKLLSTLTVPVDLVDLQGVELRRSLQERIAREGVLLCPQLLQRRGERSQTNR